MTADEQREKAEWAKKSMIVERDIILATELLGPRITADRKAGLMDLALEELQELAQRIRGASTGREVTSMIVAAIADSEEKRRGTEEESSPLAQSARIWT